MADMGLLSCVSCQVPRSMASNEHHIPGTSDELHLFRKWRIKGVRQRLPSQLHALRI